LGTWTLAGLKTLITRWQKELEGTGWNSNYLTNHDQPRQVSRFGNEKLYRVESAKMLGTFVHTLQGTPYIYQGEEIGMTNVAYETIAEYNDIETVNQYHELVDEKGADPAQVRRVSHAKSPDNSRTPMQWADGPQAGFTGGIPWLKVNPNFKEINIAQALANPNSIYYYYQKLIRLRKTIPVVVYGTYDLILPEHDQIYAFTRTFEKERLVVILNFSADTPLFEMPGNIPFTSTNLLIGNYPVDPTETINRIHMRPYEARVYLLGS
jgi:oligo-1,6-glucosidase